MQVIILILNILYQVVATTIKNANVALVFTFLHKVVQVSCIVLYYHCYIAFNKKLGCPYFKIVEFFEHQNSFCMLHK